MKLTGLLITWLAAGSMVLCSAEKCPTEIATGPEPASFRAGLRSSPYGPQNGFPAPQYWLSAARSMASRFEHAVPTLVWIVGTMEKKQPATMEKNFSDRVRLSFPAPNEKKIANIVFAAQDVNEAYLEQFDRNGFQVWLQVEPAHADVGTLIDLVLTRYAQHRWSSVSASTSNGTAGAWKTGPEWASAMPRPKPGAIGCAVTIPLIDCS